MNVKLLSIPIVLTGGTGVTYFSYRYLSSNEKKESIGSKLGSSLLGMDDSFDSKWEERATLVTSKTNLHPSLEKLRDSTSHKISSENIRDWCREQSKKEFSDESDSLFQGIRSFCTFNNKDKLTGKAISENLENNGVIKPNGKWFKANDKLKKASGNLSIKMKELKNELSKSSGTVDEKVLKNWCESAYTEYFKDSKDQDFKDVESYCTEVTESTPTVT